MNTPTVYLTPADYDAAVAFKRAADDFPCSYGERTLNEVTDLEQQILADCQDTDSCLYDGWQDNATLEIDQGGRLWAEVSWCDETVTELVRALIRPLPLPGSWHDPALDPSNAPARTPTALECNPWLAAHEAAQQLPEPARGEMLTLLGYHFNRLSATLP